MIYLDTSVLLPLFVPEPTSETLHRRLKSLPRENLTISEWSRAEFVSAIGIHVRAGRLQSLLAQAAVQTFREIAEASLLVLAPDREDFLLAAQFLEQFDLGLRAGDALHLAIAANHKAREVYTFDRVLIRCAHKLNINAHLPV